MARAQASLVIAAAVVIAIIAAALGTASGASSYTVGEPGGSWDLQTNLTAWSSTTTFHRGDQLLFRYDATAHDVVEVTQAGYASYSAASPVGVVGALQNGSSGVVTFITLYGVGTRYFICGKPGHCDAGMKMQVNVTLPACRNDSGFVFCRENVPRGSAPGTSASQIGSLFVTVVSLLLFGILTIG